MDTWKPRLRSAAYEAAWVESGLRFKRISRPVVAHWFRFKVSQKGALSIYGVWPFSNYPVTLYADQWDRLLKIGGAIRQAISDNRKELR